MLFFLIVFEYLSLVLVLMIFVNDLILFHNLIAFYDTNSMIDYLIGTN